MLIFNSYSYSSPNCIRAVGELYPNNAGTYCSGTNTTLPPIGGYNGAWTANNVTLKVVADSTSNLGEYCVAHNPSSVITNQYSSAYISTTPGTAYNFKIKCKSITGEEYQIQLFDLVGGFTPISLANTNTDWQEFTLNNYTAGGTLCGLYVRYNAAAPLNAEIRIKVTAQLA